MRPADSQGGTAAGADSPDGIELLAEALLAYFQEIQADADICWRHEATIAIRNAGRCLSVWRRFSGGQAIEAHMVNAAMALGSWEESPWSNTDLRRWSRLHRAVSDRAGKRPVLLRGVAWEGRPVLIHAVASGGPESIIVALLLPSVSTDLPEVSSRTLARALRCHEHLIPAIVAQPLPASAADGLAGITIREFLKRTMPRNLLASQCFFAGSAGT